ncbi:MAG TPA: FAD-dependent oxidoreductase [Xanthobacteraceae bacterium]
MASQSARSAAGFDYIVIGAGSAGCIVARRLSEDGSRVLLLEAGPPARSLWVSMPAGMSKLFTPGVHNWGYATEAEPHLGGRTVYAPRGRGLGGSSLINGMVYVRGQREDYETWRQLGNAGWAWADVLPYFKKLEHRAGAPSEHRGRGGEIWVSDSADAIRHPVCHDFIEACARNGLPRNEDYNGEDQEGAGFLQFSIRNGVRHDAATAFLAPALKRPNLAVTTEALVHRIAFDGRRATGVEYSTNGELRSARAREVIMCAGALDSPKLLMLSGIGPAEELRSHGIAVVHDLPGVGHNLQDHFNTPYTCRTASASSVNEELRGLRLLRHGAHYLLARKGLLTMGSSQAYAFARVMPTASRPDIQINFRPVSWEYDAAGIHVVGTSPAVTASIGLLRPHARGRVRLRSADAHDAPRIHANYLDSMADCDTVVAGMHLLRKIFATQPLKSHVLAEQAPGDSCRSDDEILDYFRRAGQSMHHWAGTCKMGTDAMAVVDDRLRVRGVDALRVIDASVMPLITSGNTHAPTLMIGAKGADLVTGRSP